METQTSKKTGATPLAEELLGGGEIIGVIETKTVMVRLRDGHGKEMVKLAIVVPGGEVYFLDESAVKVKQAQTWVKKGVLSKLGLTP